MRKYLKILRVSVAQYFVYRLSFVLWRVRNVLGLIFTYFLWTSLFSKRLAIFSYTFTQLITYILLINIVSAIILSTRTGDIANEILRGDIANYLLKPFSFFKFSITREITDKLINFIFSIVEIALIVIILKPNFFLQTNPTAYLFLALAIIAATLISFFISLILSFVAFWSTEIWAPRFIYIMLVSFVAGTFFPLDILPKHIYNFLLLTPFPYLVYFPTKIYIHGFSNELIIPLAISFFWAAVVYFLALKIWKSGLKNYSAYGR